MSGVFVELQDTVGGVLEANTTRTTVVIKLKKDVDIMLSPMALESAQLFLEVGTLLKRKSSKTDHNLLGRKRLISSLVSICDILL